MYLLEALGGKTFLMELRKGLKGFTVFTLVVVLIAGGMTQLYPVVQEAMEPDEMEGAEFVILEVGDEGIYLRWVTVPEAVEYVVMEDSHPYMVTSYEIERTPENHTMVVHAEGERYFAVIYVTDEGEFPLGMVSAQETKDPLEVLMETPFYRMFTAGRPDLTFDEMEGFLSVELYSWWILLVGVYLSYLSVKSITDDYQEKRMDIIFSTPLSRERYMVEKFSALGVVVLVMIVLSGVFVMLAAGTVSDGGGTNLLVALVISWPMFLVIIAVSMFLAVVTGSSRKAVGLSFAFIMLNYGVFMAGHMVDSLSVVHPFTICHYWDYNSVLLDGVVYPWHLVLLTAIALVVLVLSTLFFRKKDIPS